LFRESPHEFLLQLHYRQAIGTNDPGIDRLQADYFPVRGLAPVIREEPCLGTIRKADSRIHCDRTRGENGGTAYTESRGEIPSTSSWQQEEDSRENSPAVHCELPRHYACEPEQDQEASIRQVRIQPEY